MESENSISRRRVRELELELEECKKEVAKERTKVLERETAEERAAQDKVSRVSKMKASKPVNAVSNEDMEDLRERVSAPELVGERIPVEVHMKAIRAGLDRLQSDRIKAQKREEDTYKRIAGIEEDD